MSFAKASLWTASSILTKIVCGLLIIKLLAVSYGPQGIGLASNYRQLITVLAVLAGAGIFNGVTRYVAEFQHDRQQLRQLLSTASLIVLATSLLLGLLLWLFAPQLSQQLFATRDFSGVIRCVAFLQCGIAWANLWQAQLKGLRDARGNALIVVAGCLLAIPGYLICWWLGDYQGALVGMALVPAIVLLPAYLIWRRRSLLHSSSPIIIGWNRHIGGQLLKYSVMTAITAVTLPGAWIMMRQQLANYADWQAVGLWQGVASVSDAYLQFITATFSLWLLPALSRLTDKRAIGTELGRTLLKVMPCVIILSFGVWLLRDLIIWLLFSVKFQGMRELFTWQLPGDVFKVAAYIFGYLVIAKGSLRAYLLTEMAQFSLLLLSSHWLIPAHGVIGAVQAYCFTYFCYLLLVVTGFWLWYRK